MLPGSGSLRTTFVAVLPTFVTTIMNGTSRSADELGCDVFVTPTSAELGAPTVNDATPELFSSLGSVVPPDVVAVAMFVNSVPPGTELGTCSTRLNVTVVP